MITRATITRFLPLLSSVLAAACASEPGEIADETSSAITTPWMQIGIAGRPLWVDASIDRRLRLLASLPAIDARIQSQANGYIGTNGPGLSVGLVLSDGLYFSKAAGYRDAAKQHAADENTAFGVGSLTKVFTGTALLAMIDNPSLVAANKTPPHSLDDAASTWLPELADVCPPAHPNCARGQQNLGIKLRHMVSHTSALSDEMHLNGNAISNEAQWLGEFEAQTIPFSPGKWSAYSGVGVEGIGLLIGRIAKERAVSAGGLPNERSYELFVKHHVLDPLGMKSSGIGEPSVAASKLANKWSLQWAPSGSTSATPTFVSSPSYTDPEMLMPAGGSGGVVTTVHDLSLFIQMWLSQSAPIDPTTNAPILKTSTLANARASALPHSVGVAPAGCGDFNGTDGAYYSGCGDAAGFGVNWFVLNTPAGCQSGTGCNYIEHNGSTGLWGSQTRLHIASGMAATGLISTDPYPSAASIGRANPPSVSSSFMNDVVYGVLDNAMAFDAANTSWQGSAPAVGVARVLWLSGALNNASTLKNHFTPAFLTSHGLLTTQAVSSYVASTFQAAGACYSFRVRGASGGVYALRLRCQDPNHVWKTLDLSLTVESASPYRIAGITGAGVTSEVY